MDCLQHKDARALWEAWQARKRAVADADDLAVARGEKTREQLVRENGAVPVHIAEAALPWDELLSLEW
jgi:hypothetical protein